MITGCPGTPNLARVACWSAACRPIFPCPPVLVLCQPASPLCLQGYYSYYSVNIAAAAYPGYSGYLLTNDDALLHCWNFNQTDFTTSFAVCNEGRAPAKSFSVYPSGLKPSATDCSTVWWSTWWWSTWWWSKQAARRQGITHCEALFRAGRDTLGSSTAVQLSKCDSDVFFVAGPDVDLFLRYSTRATAHGAFL